MNIGPDTGIFQYIIKISFWRMLQIIYCLPEEEMEKKKQFLLFFLANKSSTATFFLLTFFSPRTIIQDLELFLLDLMFLYIYVCSIYLIFF